MFVPNKARSLLLGTALTLPLATSAVAQTIDVNPEELSGKSQECQNLGEMIFEMQAPVTTVSADDVVVAINEDNSEQCATFAEQIAASDSESQQQDNEQTSAQVEVTEDATIEGQATVTVPDPNVDVQVPAPRVRVTEQHPQVSIAQQPTDIQVMQAQPTISVEIPDIIVRVEIPAPTFYILSSDPQVQVSTADPQVQVEQDAPTISVRQADPELSVDLGVDTDGQAQDSSQSSSDSDEPSDQSRTAEGDTSMSATDPQVEIVMAEGEPQLSLQVGDPTVTYQSSEPNIQILMAEQPTIEVQQTGEPTVTIETAEEREQRINQQSEQNASEQNEDVQPPMQPEGEQQQPQSETEQATSEPAPAEQPASSGTMISVADLMTLEVVTSDGESLGTPEAFVEVNGEPNLVLSSGGFLGLGAKQVPVPMSRVTIQNGALLLNQLNEDEIENANNFEYDENLVISDDQQIEIGGN